MDQTVRLLAHLARLTVASPASQLMIGYLLANPERVEWVEGPTDDAGLGMTFSAHRRIEVPGVPWQGFVRGVPIPDPLLWLQATEGQRGQRIRVKVATDDPILTQALAELTRPTRIRAQRREMEARMASLRAEVDRTLDIYAEVRRLMESEEAGRDPELPQFLKLAERQMQELGEELARLKARMGSEASG
jgi:hypothetical protein